MPLIYYQAAQSNSVCYDVRSIAIDKLCKLGPKASIMRICLVLRSKERCQTDLLKEQTKWGTDIDSNFSSDLLRFIDTNNHQWERREVCKETAIDDIDSIYEEGFDVFVDYLLCDDVHDSSWIKSSAYLWNKNTPCIGPHPQIFSSGIGGKVCDTDVIRNKTVLQPNHGGAICSGPKLDILKTLANEAESSSSNALPNQTKLLTPSDNAQQPAEQVEDASPIFRYTIIVLIMGRKTVALRPHKDYDNNKGHSQRLYNSTHGPPFVEDKQDLALKAIAVEAFDALRGENYAAYASVNINVNDVTGRTQNVRVNFRPLLFIAGKTTGENLMIEHSFPGGLAAFFEQLLSTRLATEPKFVGRNSACAERHDAVSEFYEDILRVTNVTANRLSYLVDNFDYNGTVLECCSGSGALARFMLDANVRAKFTAVELSSKMAELPDCTTLYKQPILIGPIQETLMSMDMHDHVVCFGSFHLFNKTDFVASLSQMFLRARKSVSFDVDDLSDRYISGAVSASEAQQGTGWLDYNNNNVAAAVHFGVPAGWRAVVYNQRRFAYHSPLMKEDVYTHSYRFEAE